MVDNKNNNCEFCGEPELIQGVCYDCAIVCNVCRTEPAHPRSGVCSGCEKEAIEPMEIDDD